MSLSDDSKLEFKKHVFDNVHGFIGITELEYKIISSPFFQRLRRIKQLSLLDYVFPGATHSRFSHSLGVMYIADNMVLQLQKDGFLEGRRQLVRMAALLHDVGHYPLSHLIEETVQKDARLKIKSNKGKIIQIEDNNGSDDEEKPTKQYSLDNNEVHKRNFDWHDSRNASNDFAHHERMAGIVISNTPLHNILVEDGTFSEDDIKTISQIIAGTLPAKGPESLIIHSELDADRFDYLLRDSKNTGVTYGLFDINQIIRHLKYVDKGILAVDEKAIKSIEHYLMCRYFLYTTVIYHKAAIGFWIMAKKIYEGLLERGMVFSYFDLIDIFKNEEESNKYLDYDDSYFFNKIKNISQNGGLPKEDNDFKISNKFLMELIEKVLSREPLKLALEQSKLIDKKSKNKPERLDGWLREQVSLTRKIEDCWYIPFSISESPTKISPYVSIENFKHLPEGIDESIKTYRFDSNNEIKTNLLINNENSIIHILGNYNLKIERVYTKNKEYKEIIVEKQSEIERYLERLNEE